MEQKLSLYTKKKYKKIHRMLTKDVSIKGFTVGPVLSCYISLSEVRCRMVLRFMLRMFFKLFFTSLYSILILYGWRGSKQIINMICLSFSVTAKEIVVLVPVNTYVCLNLLVMYINILKIVQLSTITEHKYLYLNTLVYEYTCNLLLKLRPTVIQYISNQGSFAIRGKM